MSYRHRQEGRRNCTRFVTLTPGGGEWSAPLRKLFDAWKETRYQLAVSVFVKRFTFPEYRKRHYVIANL